MNEFDDEQRDELEPEAELVALQLAAGDSHAEAALTIGRSAKWVQRKLKDDQLFRQRVVDLEAQRGPQAAAGFGALLEAAVGTTL